MIQSEHPAETIKRELTDTPTRYLTCCCCGEGTRGRQWHNRDLGYGLCPKCAGFIASKPLRGGESVTQYMRDCYGIAGIHYFTEEPA